MKKTLLTIAFAAGFAGTAAAADMAVKAPRYVEPVANWTGCYIGAGAGYGMWNQERYGTSATTGLQVTPNSTIGGRGWFGTVQAGCDYQFAPRWVAGVFGDYDFGRLKGNYTPTVSSSFGGEETMRSAWSVGGRVGYVVLPQLLTYVSAGYTEARFGDITMLPFGGATPVLTIPGTTYKGWFLGTGYEYGLDFLPGLFWKTEYRFAQYRAQDLPLFVSNGGVSTINNFEHEQKYIQTIRSELVYRFNWGGPIVARY